MAGTRRCTLAAVLVLVLAACSSDDLRAAAPSPDSGLVAESTILDRPTPTDSVVDAEIGVSATPTTAVGPAAAGPMSCATDEDVASIGALLRTGQPTYDYQPARNLAELVDWADVVVAGTLVSAERVGEYTALEVANVERLSGTGDVVTIGSMSLWASGQGPDPLGTHVDFDGLVFIAFLGGSPDAPGGWAPHVEGLGFACSTESTTTESLAGLVSGTLGMSLAEMAAEVRAVVAGEPGAGQLGVTRPVFADDVCPALSADERSTVDGITFFARPSEEPVTVQVIAESGATPADPFALLLRYPSADLRTEGGDPIDVAGYSVSLRVFPNGNGVATWELADGSVAYLRSRGMTEADVIEIIDIVIPVSPSEVFPGFRVDLRRDPVRFQSLHEGFDTEVTGSSAASECELPANAGSYRVDVVIGDPLYQFGAVLDRSVPIEVGYRAGTLLIIGGGPDVGTAPTVRDVVDADPATWQSLLGAPNWLEREASGPDQ